jgi:DNA mismatch repair protein MSH3
MSSKHYAVLREAVAQLAIADCIMSFAHIALRSNYVCPEFTESDALEIVDGRHPMIEELRPDPFVPNSIKMGDGTARNKIITGPNMGGLVPLSCCLSVFTCSG